MNFAKLGWSGSRIKAKQAHLVSLVDNDDNHKQAKDYVRLELQRV